MEVAPSKSPKPSRDAQDDIIYMLGHDLRASIRAIHELPAWLRDDLEDRSVDLSGEPDEVLSLMQTHADRLDAMLSGLLAYSRVGRVQQLCRVKPADIFEQVLSALAPPEEAQIFCRFNPVTVEMGEADIAKSFEVLLSNALAHGRSENEVRIEVTSCKSGDVWELMVADCGPGIADHARRDALKPMTRLAADPQTGAGMGLAILDRIASQYGGDLSIEGRRRRGGCLVRLRLPVLAA